MAYLSNRQAPLCGADPFGLELLHASISLVTKSDARVRFSVPTFFLLYDLWSLYVVGLRVRTRAVHGSSRNGKPSATSTTADQLLSTLSACENRVILHTGLI